MQPMKLYFDVRDIFRAPRLALSGKKIIVFIQANLIGYLLIGSLTIWVPWYMGYHFPILGLCMVYILAC